MTREDKEIGVVLFTLFVFTITLNLLFLVPSL